MSSTLLIGDDFVTCTVAYITSEKDKDLYVQASRIAEEESK